MSPVNLTERGLVLIEELLVKEGIMDEGESLYSPANIMLMHHVTAALRAHALFTRDVDYIVKDGEVIIVDEHTGRTMQGRRWSDGLHRLWKRKKVCRSRTKTKRWLRSPSRTTSVCMKTGGDDWYC
ncbi:hypothetical protein DMH20_24245 [Escherichia coli]|nr:hypothetical protein [Escherichia coli]